MDEEDSPLNFHREIHSHSRTGGLIYIACYCAIRHDHGYEEWVQRFADWQWRERYRTFQARHEESEPAAVEYPWQAVLRQRAGGQA